MTCEFISIDPDLRCRGKDVFHSVFYSLNTLLLLSPKTEHKTEEKQNYVASSVFLLVSASPRYFIVNIHEENQTLETKSSSEPTEATNYRKLTPASRIVS